MKVVTTDQIRELDRLAVAGGIPARQLMFEAGKEVTRVVNPRWQAIEKSGRRPTYLALVYKGNNGGDALAAAWQLAGEHRDGAVALFCAPSEMSVAGRYFLKQLTSGRGRKPESLTRVFRVRDTKDLRAQTILDPSTIVIDGLFGTGLKRSLGAPFDEMVRRVNASGARVVSVDIPSGLDADTGEPMGKAIRADVTVTMGLPKIGLLKEPAIDFVGKLVVGKLSYPPELIERIKTDVHLIHPDAVCPLLPRRKFSAHKGDFGHALLLAGSQGLSGAATLCATAAARSGAGLTTLMVPQKIYPFVASAVPPEIMVRPAPSTGAGTFLDTAYGHLEEAAWPSRANALGCGCGLGQHPKTRQFVEDLLLEWPHAMVLDADALNCIAVHPGLLLEAKGPVILTPHPGEMARLVHKTVDSVQTHRWEVAQRFARENKVIVVLKGARTVVTDGTELWINATGNPAMASGGMGDALTGIIVGLLAQGLKPFDAARTGVYLHGLAGDLALEKSGGRVLLASDLIGCLNQAFAAVE